MEGELTISNWILSLMKKFQRNINTVIPVILTMFFIVFFLVLPSAFVTL